MVRFTRWLRANADGVVALLVAATVGILAILDLLGADEVNAAILLVLALLAATLLKDRQSDVVTDLDLAAERLIVGHIRDTFPRHQIISEESGLHDADDSSWVWLVDPLDGTNNVVIGLSAYVVGIALCENKVPVLGVVHDPVAGQTWSAVTGLAARAARRCAHPTGRPLAGQCWPGRRTTA